MLAAATVRAEEFVARPGRALRALLVQGDLPRQGLRDGAVVTQRPSTPPSSSPRPARRRLDLQPAAVRGDHRAARAGRRHRRRRLRQDHGDGRPGGLAGRHRPGRARRDPRPDLHHQGHRRAPDPDPRQPPQGRPAARRGPPGSATTRSEVEEPTVATYHSYASALLSEHGLRIGHEPDTRLIADASRYQLAARAVQRYTTPGRPAHRLAPPRRPVPPRPRRRDERAPRRPRDGARVRRPPSGRCSSTGWPTEHRKTYREKNEKAIAAIDRRAELLGLVEAYRGLKAHLGLMDFSDQIALAARLAETRPEVGRGRAREVPGRAARRVPGHLGRPGADAEPAVLRAGPRARPRPPGHRGRRPQPGDLRLARRLGLQHPRVRRRLPGPRRPRRDVPPHRQPPLRRADPGRPPTTSPPSSTPAGPSCCRWRPKPGAGARRGARGRARDLRRRAGLAGRPGARDPRRRWPSPALAGDRRADPRQLARGRGLRRAERPRDPGRDRRPQGSAPAARGRPRWSPP